MYEMSLCHDISIPAAFAVKWPVQLAPRAQMTELSSGDGRPRYRKLADLFRKRIVSGRYAVGSLLPTELEICQQHAVSRTTAREALRALTVEGLVSRRAGHGTRVESASPVTRYSQAGSSIDGLLSERIRLW